MFLQLTQDKKSMHEEDRPFSVSETVSDAGSIKSFSADASDVIFSSNKISKFYASVLYSVFDLSRAED